MRTFPAQFRSSPRRPQPQGRGAAHRGAVEQAHGAAPPIGPCPGHRPSLALAARLIDRALTPRIADARIGELATLEVTVTEHRRGGPRRGCARPLPRTGGGSSGALELVYFNADPAYLKRLLPEGSRRLISGKLEAYDGWLQMPHPDHVVAVDDTKGGAAKLPLLEPVYPLTAGLTNTPCARASPRRSPACRDLPEWIDKAWREQNAWPGFADALRRMHAPQSTGRSRSRRRRRGAARL